MSTSDITLAISPASIRVDVTIRTISQSAAQTIASSLTSLTTEVSAASAALGVTVAVVVSPPSVQELGASSGGGGGGGGGAAIGAAIGGVVVLLLIARFWCRRGSDSGAPPVQNGKMYGEKTPAKIAASKSVPFDGMQVDVTHAILRIR